MTVPCLRCIACRIAITREWTTRLMHEAQYHKENCFITLTYRTDDLPADRSLSKRVLQLFIKRLRKKLGETKIKYYGVGEYGEEHDREHYHIIVFGWQPPLGDLYVGKRKKGKIYYASRTLDTVWTHGFNVVGNVTRHSCQYTVGYVRKKLYGSRAAEVYAGRLQPFALQSKGLGASYVFDHREDIEKHLCVREGKKNFGLPRYYQRIAFIDPARLVEKRLQKDAEMLKHYEKFSDKDIFQLVLLAREQTERNLLMQERMKR